MKTIYVSKDICERIKTDKDLSDFYAYCERDFKYWEVNNAKDEEEYMNALPTYLFEDERIAEELDFNYRAGEYDEENVKRILGGL